MCGRPTASKSAPRRRSGSFELFADSDGEYHIKTSTTAGTKTAFSSNSRTQRKRRKTKGVPVYREEDTPSPSRTRTPSPSLVEFNQPAADPVSPIIARPSPVRSTTARSEGPQKQGTSVTSRCNAPKAPAARPLPLPCPNALQAQLLSTLRIPNPEREPPRLPTPPEPRLPTPPLRPPPLPPRPPTPPLRPPTPPTPRLPTPTVVLNPHPVHFYHDGNLLIELAGVHFKVLWSLMAKASTFFQERYDFWKNDDEKAGCLTGKVAVILDEIDGKGIKADDFAELLNLMHLSNPLQLENQYSLKTILSILTASHILSFGNHLKWAKDRLVSLWSIGDDFENLPLTAQYTAKEARETFTLAKACQINDVLKAALYALLRLPYFGIEEADRRNTCDWHTGIDFLAYRERLSTHWVTTLDRLHLPSCAGQPKKGSDTPSTSFTMEKTPTTSSKVSGTCTSDNPSKSDGVHYRLLVKSELYAKFMIDPLVGIHTLKSQLIPPPSFSSSSSTSTNSNSAKNRNRRKRKRGLELGVEDSDSSGSSSGTKPAISPWAVHVDGLNEVGEADGGYCDDCLKSMYEICEEAMEECWDMLDEWIGGVLDGTNGTQEEEDDDGGLEYV